MSKLANTYLLAVALSAASASAQDLQTLETQVNEALRHHDRLGAVQRDLAAITNEARETAMQLEDARTKCYTAIAGRQQWQNRQAQQAELCLTKASLADENACATLSEACREIPKSQPPAAPSSEYENLYINNLKTISHNLDKIERRWNATVKRTRERVSEARESLAAVRRNPTVDPNRLAEIETLMGSLSRRLSWQPPTFTTPVLTPACAASTPTPKVVSDLRTQIASCDANALSKQRAQSHTSEREHPPATAKQTFNPLLDPGLGDAKGVTEAVKEIADQRLAQPIAPDRAKQPKTTNESATPLAGYGQTPKSIEKAPPAPRDQQNTQSKNEREKAIADEFGEAPDAR